MPENGLNNCRLYSVTYAADPIGEALVSFNQFRSRFGIPYDRSTIYKMRQAGSFPAPLQLSPGTIAWRVADITAWLSSRPRVGQPEPPPIKSKTKKRAAPVRRGVATRKKHAAEGVQP